MIAGGRYGTSNITYYLYTGNRWWTGSPYGFGRNAVARVFYVSANGVLSESGATSNFIFPVSARPSISLKNNIVVSSGDGSVDNPYIILTD